MRLFRRVVIGIALAIVALLVLFPPYYGRMLASEGEVHSNLGYYPVWDPPTSDECRARLREIFRDAPEAVLLAQGNDLAAYRVGFNKIRFAFNVVVLLVGLLLVVAIGKFYSKPVAHSSAVGSVIWNL